MDDYANLPIRESGYTMTTPVFAGYYQIGGKSGLQVHLPKRPPWLHRTMMRMLLGWEWFDGALWP